MPDFTSIFDAALPTRTTRAASTVAALALLAACPGGDGGDDTSTGATEPATSTTPSGTDGPPTSGPTTTSTGDVPDTTESPSTPATDTETTDAPTTDAPTTDAPTTDPTDTDSTTGDPVAAVTVHLVPNSGVGGPQRVNFAVPLAPGQLADAAAVVVRHGDAEQPAALRGLARHPDGTWRSVQVQLDLEVSGETDLELEIGSAPSLPAPALVPVADTLVDDATGPNVWALLPPEWLTASRLAGPLGTAAAAEGTPGAAWAALCDYDAWDLEAFLGSMASADVWLYDRGTIFYRGHARRGDLGSLRTAYLETTIYRDGLTGGGPDTEIGVPGKAGDAKYYYSQNLALHYLMTGDDRFRESAEDVAEAFDALWDPEYDGGDGFWTERHAGFGLLAYTWAMIVSDDQSEQFRGLADAAVAAYIDVQETYPLGYADPDARCFAHSDVAADEDFGYFGCSPWLSAILADGLDQYASESPGAQADAARTSIIKLGRIVARDGLDPGGKPFYWMAVGNTDGAVDDYDEHWGESAYVVALAWYHDGASDPELAMTAAAITDGFAQHAEAPHMRSFNWQCRSAVATPWLLAQ
ncbi:MAG: hypothetical protein JNL82_22700 [Myxococcales bacterium]|nr:hypothetical protein [Myxococcales bacterium]